MIFDFFGTLTPSIPAGIWDDHAARSAAPLGIPMRQWRRALIELAETWPTLPLAPLVDAVALSCQEGRRKPDPELFRRVAEKLDTPPGHCLYVGDGGSDELSGATAHGMTAVMLRADDWATNDAHAREDDWPGPFFSTLSEVVSADRDPSVITAGA